MHREQFRELCARASEILKLKDLHALGAARKVSINDVQLVLFYDEVLAPQKIQILSDLGVMPEKDQLTTYRNLLAINNMLGSLQDAVFGIDDVSEHVIFANRVTLLSRVNEKQIAEMLVEYAAQIKSWITGNIIPRPLDDPLEKVLSGALTGH